MLIARLSGRPAAQLPPALVVTALIAASIYAAEPPRIESWNDDSVVVAGADAAIRVGNQTENWTLMALVCDGETRSRQAVFEDFTSPAGKLLIVDLAGAVQTIAKTAEPTDVPPNSLYRGHTFDQVLHCDRDLLGDEILAQPGDPTYDAVAACLPPMTRIDPYSFVGTLEIGDKPGVAYGGRTANFDPAIYLPTIRKIRDDRKVMTGLVGGWLPALRFVYPEKPGDWTELVMFAPLGRDNNNPRVQPVWYRVCRVENGRLAWARYIDSYIPVAPRDNPDPSMFYRDLVGLRDGWNRLLAGSTTVQLPDERYADLARHSLARAMMTRVGGFPKYGVLDRNYGSAEHDGFPDTFNVDASAMLAWGLTKSARDIIDNFLTYFVREDGSLVYRGPETGQYGRMLTVIAEYARLSRDDALLLKHRIKIDAVTRILLERRRKALELPATHAAYGMISGWCEADSCLETDPSRYDLPYLSNSAEASRGWRDLGREWTRIGRSTDSSDLVDWGSKLTADAGALEADVHRAIQQSRLQRTDGSWIPCIAGATELPHEATAKDMNDPQCRAYRAYMEMMFSGLLTREEADTIRRYRAAHRDQIAGIPTAYGYNTGELVGFLSYGHAFALLQHDFVREYLLLLHSLAAHQYTRGQWMAPETRLIHPDRSAAPYCVPAQLTAPLLVRWMLVFENPADDSLTLGKAIPRDWLGDGKTVSIRNAPTSWGELSYQIDSHMKDGRIDIAMRLPPRPIGQRTSIRLRAPDARTIKSVELNGKPWQLFDVRDESIALTTENFGEISLCVHY